MNYLDYITIEPNKRGGKPCVRGLRIPVYEVLEYLASDMTEGEILDDLFPGSTHVRDIGLKAADDPVVWEYAGNSGLMIVSKDSQSNKHGCTWSELLKRRLSACSIRKAPTWTHGTIEASYVVEVDFSSGARLITLEKDVLPVFKRLKQEPVKRNPCGCFS